MESADHEVEAGCARGQERGVWRGEDEPRRRERHECERDGSRECRRSAAELPGNERGEQACHSAGDHGEEPDGEGGWCSPHDVRERGSGADQDGDGRRVVEVTAGEVARPIPVVRLVRKERQDCGEEQAHQQCDERHDERGAPEVCVAWRCRAAGVGHALRQRAVACDGAQW